MLEIIGFAEERDDPGGQEKECDLIESFNPDRGEVLHCICVSISSLFDSAMAHFSVVNFIWLGVFFFSRLNLEGFISLIVRSSLSSHMWLLIVFLNPSSVMIQ